MKLRTLFCDQYAQLQKRFTNALDSMFGWANASRFIDGCDGYDLRTCPDAYNKNISEITYIWRQGWKVIDEDGQQSDIEALDLCTHPRLDRT